MKAKQLFVKVTKGKTLVSEMPFETKPMNDNEIKFAVYNALYEATQQMYDALCDRHSELYVDGKASCLAETVAHGIEKIPTVAKEIIDMGFSYRALAGLREGQVGEYAAYLTSEMESLRENAFYLMSSSELVAACSSRPPVGIIDKVMPK